MRLPSALALAERATSVRAMWRSGRQLKAQRPGIPGICPGGQGHWSDPTGTITANGSGDSATWSGGYACPAVEVDPCSSVVFTYSNVTATLNGAHLTVIASGKVAGSGDLCSQSGTVNVTFSD
jgi:hypothetical protein